MTTEKTAQVVRAIVVSDGELEEARKEALFFCSIGILRAAFSDPEEAERWESEWADALSKPVQRT